MEAEYLLALTTGLLGGFGHCIGMCGPLIAGPALGFSSQRVAKAFPEQALSQALYHAGRITTYGIVGAIMGLAGSFIDVAGRMAGIQNTVMVLAGFLMILMGLSIVGFFRSGWLERHNIFILRAAKKLLDGVSRLRYYPLGLILGLLPCGLSYTVFIAAAGTGSPGAGTLTMLAFGMGTVPALAFFGVLVSYFGSQARRVVQKAGGVTVIVMGVLYLIKGIKLYAEM